MTIKLTFKDVKDFIEKLDKVTQVRKVMALVAESMDRWVLKSLDPKVQFNLAGNKLKRRTGRLASGISYSTAVVRGDSVSLDMLSTEPYSRIQDVGGTIKAKPGSWLTVPLPAALTPVGVVRAPARSWPNTFFKKTKSGNTVLFQKKGGGAIVPLFVLKKEVKIRATNWASGAIESTSSSLPEEIFEVIFGEVIFGKV